MNVGEYGIVFRFGVSFDMSGESSLTFNFTKPDGTTLSVPGLLGTTQISTPLGSFAANTWAYYTFVQGDVDQIGAWTVRLTYLDASPARLISTIGHFTVNE